VHAAWHANRSLAAVWRTGVMQRGVCTCTSHDHTHLCERSGTAIEVERAGVLAERAQHAGVRLRGQHHHRFLLAAAPQALISALPAVHKPARPPQAQQVTIASKGFRAWHRR